jgi:hypothetical protein
MTTQESYRVTFIADTSFTNELKIFAGANPESIEIESERSEEEATRLGFDLATASAIVTIITGTLYVGELSAKMLGWLQKSKGNKVILQTPFKTVELHKSEKLTEEDIRKFLAAAQVLDQ